MVAAGCCLARLVAGGLLTLASATAVAAGVECGPAERTAFACSTGAKSVSVCSSETATPGGPGFLQYRFGGPAGTELAYPLAGSDWRQVVTGGSLTFSGGGGAFLAFAHPPYRYVVYTAIGRGWGARAGVVVEKEGRRITHLPCVGPATSELGPDLFSAAGITVADDGFVLP